MTTTYFTICSNNYLAQATVLGKSLVLHEPSSTFLILLADLKSDAIDYRTIPFEVIPIASIEPRADELAARYGIIEFNTCIKPRMIEYLFTERNADRVVYLDPDVRVYAPLTDVDQTLNSADVVLTPHAYTSIALDGKMPTDNLFLQYGIYNLGFIGLKRNDQTLRLARWWKERTFTGGYVRLDLGQFVDQLYINLVPIIFDRVSILRHVGHNVAPWNFHERVLSVENGEYRVNSCQPLVFFHFSSFRIDSGELPRHYTRFAMKDRPDLVDLYAAYNQELKDAGYFKYSRIRWAYRPVDGTPGPLLLAKRKAGVAVRGGIFWALRRLPSFVTVRAHQILAAAKAGDPRFAEKTPSDWRVSLSVGDARETAVDQRQANA